MTAHINIFIRGRPFTEQTHYNDRSYCNIHEMAPLNKRTIMTARIAIFTRGRHCTNALQWPPARSSFRSFIDSFVHSSVRSSVSSSFRLFVRAPGRPLTRPSVRPHVSWTRFVDSTVRLSVCLFVRPSIPLRCSFIHSSVSTYMTSFRLPARLPDSPSVGPSVRRSARQSHHLFTCLPLRPSSWQ